MTPPPPRVPKPSQVTFTPAVRYVPCKPTNARILTIRSSGPFRRGKHEHCVLIWCVSSNHPCCESVTDFTPETYAHLREGKLLTTINGAPIRVQWKTILHKNLMAEACDILVNEHRDAPTQPLEFYTPLLEFAKHFRQLFAQSDTISWARNYPTDILPADELCLSFGKSFASAYEKEIEQTRTWSHLDGATITGHAPIPEHWRKTTGILHIAADASASRRNAGACAYITSRGNFHAQPADGPILECELRAISNAIQHARDLSERIIIWSDSRLALKQIALLRNGGNIFLPRRFHYILTRINSQLKYRSDHGHDDIIFRWIKAHTDCSSLQRILNDGADRLARHTMRNVHGTTFTPAIAAVCEDIVADCMNNLAQLQPCTEIPPRS